MNEYQPSECALAHPCLYTALELLCSIYHPQRYLEIGTREGDSLRRVLEYAKPSLRDLVICDSWGSEAGGTAKGSHEHIEKLLQEVNYTGSVVWLDGDSHRVLRPGIEGRQFDLILVDGDHSAAGALADLEDCWRSLVSGGMLIFDDICHPAHQYLREVYREFLAKTPAMEFICELRDTISGVAVMRMSYMTRCTISQAEGQFRR